MGCCGAKTVEILKHIGVGYANLARGKKHEFTDDSIRECHKCEWQTWMRVREYEAWLARHGIKVLKHFGQLETLPLLPKYEQDEKRRSLFCRICKCYVPAAASDPGKQCPKGRWPTGSRPTDLAVH